MERGGRRNFRRRVLLTIVLLVIIGLPLAFLAARRFERAVTFHPVAYDGGGSWNLPPGGEEVWFGTRGGVRLHGWFVHAHADAPVATVIYFHGNGGNLSYVGWLARELSARGLDVLLFDYKGYGRSEGASLDEGSVYEDAEAAYDYVVGERGVAPERVVLYGQSLGTAAAVDVASRRPCAALVLESGLSSASDMAALVVPFAPRALFRLTRNRFDSARKLAQISRPVLVAHGERDRIIPAEQGRALYEAAREPKRFILVPEAGHNNLVAVGGTKYLDKLAVFMREAVGGNLGPGGGAPE